MLAFCVTSSSRGTLARAFPLVLLGALSTSIAPPPGLAESPPLTLDRALALAFEGNPGFAVQRLEVERARAVEISAGVYPFNPELELEAADRRGPTASTTDRGVSLVQELELAGQRAKRRAVAGAELEISRTRLQRHRAELAAAVETAFAHAVAAREQARIAALDAQLAGQMVDTEVRRLEAGAGTQIDLNLARAAAGRAKSVLAGAEAESWTARAHLAELVGLDATEPPPVEGDLLPEVFPGRMSAAAIRPLEEMVQQALAQRPDLQALRRQVTAEERRLELARAEGRPNLRLQAFAAREEGDDLTGAAVGISLPLFDRNQGGVAEATVERDRARAQVAAAEASVRREVATALVRYRAGLEAVAAFDDLVVSRIDESLDLLDRAFRSGKVGIPEVLLQRRELIEARRHHVEAAESAWRARIELELATGEILQASEANEHGEPEPTEPTEPITQVDPAVPSEENGGAL